VNKQTQEEYIAERLAKGDVFEVKVGNRRFKKGDVLTITGESGEFEFLAARVTNGVVEWVQVAGKPTGKKGGVKNGSVRFFKPERIKSKKRTRDE
jgi:hypothetical protein